MSNNLQPGPISYERSGLTRGMTLGGCLGRIGLLAGVGGAGLGILVAILAVFFPNTLSGAVARLAGIPLPQTMPITGQASAWNPIAAYASVEGFAAAKAQLISFSATNVRSDGTLDLNANYSPAPQVEFRFVHEIPRPTNAPPVGAGSTGRGPWYEPVTITVYHPGERRSFYYSGGGVSAYEPQPAGQTAFPVPVAGKRGIPDAAYDGDPNTGFAVYSSVRYQGRKGWFQIGGTSAGAPQWAGLFAIVNSLRANSGMGTLRWAYNALYTVAAGTSYGANYRDVTAGANGTCGALCNAGASYDYVTGLGSPKANTLIPALVAVP